MDKPAPLEKLELRLTSPNPVAEHTLYSYLMHAGRFLNTLKHSTTPTSDDARAYLSKVKAPSYRRYIQNIIKKLFVSNKWDWDFERGESPRVGEQHQPTLTKEEVAQLVSSRLRFSPQERAYLALSTIYGTRTSEIVAVRPKDLGEKVFIRTRKGGEPRAHTIPDTIKPVLVSWTWKQTSAAAVSVHFGSMCRVAGMEVEKGTGFHAIRRALVTQLMTSPDLNPMLVWHFLRWRLSAASQRAGLTPMLGTYYHGDPEEVDRQIFDRHPFLEMWK